MDRKKLLYLITIIPIMLFINKKVHPIQVILSYAVLSKKGNYSNSCILTYRLC